MASPPNSQNQSLIFPSQNPDQPVQVEEENRPQSTDRQSPKTLTLEIPDSEDPKQQDPHVDDPNQDDPQDISSVSPTVSDCLITAVTTTSISFSRRGGGPKRKKRHPAKEKKSQKRLEVLATSLTPIPFVPIKALDFASHEALLKRLRLWDFVHLQLDANLRADLIAQLIANYNPSSRCSYVNGVRIMVNRPTLGRALKLPVPALVKKDKTNVVDNALEAKESDESIAFIEDLLSNWVLLHEDTWMMPVEILNWTKVIKEGHFERVDWAGLIWHMVEKELLAEPALGKCYYASHLQWLIKTQKKELMEEPVKMEVDGEKVLQDEEVKIHEEYRGGSDLEEHNIELTLGGLDNLVKDDGGKEGREHAGVEDAMDLEESREEEEQGPGLKSSMDGHFLRPCIGEVGNTELEDMKQAEEEKEEEGNVGEEGEEEEEGEEVGFDLSPKGDTLEGVNSENLMEGAQIPFSSELQIHDHLLSREFLVSRADSETIPGNSAFFGNGNGNRREIGHLENDIPHHSLNGGNKRMRSDGPWDMRPSSDFDVCVEQVQHLMGKARMMYGAKEQAYEEMNMNQQVLLNELQQRDSMIQHLNKAKYVELPKKQMEIYKLERELDMMGNLLEGYRKALKETHRAFAEYRLKCPVPEEPVYKDVGTQGLVLSTTELEKPRIKQEEEERLKRLLIEKKGKEFEAECIVKFEAYGAEVESLGNKLLDVEKEVNLLKEILAKRKISEMSERAAIEE